MAKQESKSKRFHKKLFSSYRMVIINEETFEEKAQLRISRFRVIVTGVLFLSLFCLTAFFTISYTPLKEYIPGYDSSELRQKAIQNLFTTDSLIILYNQNLQYLDALRGVISEDVT
ncbi:M23 family peptidase, partial [Flavobacteriaceae bacterium]|nr:M23 family peptidase [Flavobacteriaceae bacterium]